MTKKAPENELPPSPKLVSRRENRKSNFKLGRTIGEKREKLETANERASARKKAKKKKALRIIFTVIGFAGLTILLVGIAKSFIDYGGSLSYDDSYENLQPIVTITDENSSADNKITSKMRLFIVRAEKELRELGYYPTEVVIPNGKIREVDFYLDGQPGFIKMNIDRNPAVSAEDADRMLRYLEELGEDEFTYIDVRIDQKAYWK